MRVIHGGVGAVTESDVLLASASNAIIIGFNVRPEPAAKAFADEERWISVCIVLSITQSRIFRLP